MHMAACEAAVQPWRRGPGPGRSERWPSVLEVPQTDAFPAQADRKHEAAPSHVRHQEASQPTPHPGQ